MTLAHPASIPPGSHPSGSHPSGSPGGSHAFLSVQENLWRAVAAFRVLSLAYAAVSYAVDQDEYLVPAGGWVVLAVMAAWTAWTVVALSRSGRRSWALLGADLAVAVAAVVVPVLFEDPARIAEGAHTLPLTWAATPVIAFGLRGGSRAGAGAAVVVIGANLVHRGELVQVIVHNGVLLLLLGTIAGYVLRLVLDAETRLVRALAVEAATRERERLARSIHDGVLQVLAMVQRRGLAAGGEAADLGRLAGEQEIALRALVTARAEETRWAASGPGQRSPRAGAGGGGGDDTGGVDLRTLLAALVSARVSVAAPSVPVLVEAGTARDVAAAVAAALDNVARHAGEDARAWVLLEEEAERVVVSVRDDGVGIRPGRLAEAESQGRLGVAQSIRGRVEALGGELDLVSDPGAGTEIEIRVPRYPVTAPSSPGLHR